MNEPTHFVNKISSCINLIFPSDVNITSNWGTGKTIHEKCHQTGTLTFNVPLPLPYLEKSGVINMQILRIFKKLFQCLVGRKHLRTKIQMKRLGY